MGVSPAGNKRLFLFIVGLTVLYHYRKELKNYRDVFLLLTLGFLFMFAMIVKVSS